MKKHPQHILAIPDSCIDHVPTGMNATGLADFVEFAQDHLIIRQRAGLEEDTAFRQIIPYVCLATQLDGKTLFYPYVRNKGVGEERLVGNVSVGFGGHIDLADVQHNESVIDLFQTIGAAATRELSEELKFGGETTAEIAMFDNGLLVDDSNDVGLVHLGVVLTALVPYGVEVTSNEPELELMAPMSASDLLASDLPLENWTRLVLESVVAAEKDEVASV